MYCAKVTTQRYFQVIFGVLCIALYLVHVKLAGEFLPFTFLREYYTSVHKQPSFFILFRLLRMDKCKRRLNTVQEW